MPLGHCPQSPVAVKSRSSSVLGLSWCAGTFSTASLWRPSSLANDCISDRRSERLALQLAGRPSTTCLVNAAIALTLSDQMRTQAPNRTATDKGNNNGLQFSPIGRFEHSSKWLGNQRFESTWVVVELDRSSMNHSKRGNPALGISGIQTAAIRENIQDLVCHWFWQSA